MDADDITVDTVLTTSTDRRQAVQRVMISGAASQRYESLTPLYVENFLSDKSEPIDPRLPKFAKVSKQVFRYSCIQMHFNNNYRACFLICFKVDPAWLSRRQQAAPTAEDLKPLQCPDPTAPLRLVGFNGEKTVNGMKSTINSTTCWPEFSLDINYLELFGDISSTGQVKRGLEIPEREKNRFENLMRR